MNIKKWILPVLLPIQFLLIQQANYYSTWIETYYSQGIYPKISVFLRGLLGWIPFSLGDILIIFITINLLVFIFKKVLKGKVSFIEISRKTLSIASIIYLLFHLLWGLNYYRLPLHKVLSIDHKYNTEKLERVTYLLIKKSNEAHQKLEPNDTLKIKTPYSTPIIFEKTSDAYVGLEKIFPNLKYERRSIKTTLLSKIQLYMGFSGYINPFTNEAQVNKYILPYKMPTTSCHEEAHQLGFAKENEANFIGAMACMNSNDPYFQYSGYTFALRHCIHELYRQDYQKYSCAFEKINKGIIKNYKETSLFWKAYDNPLEPYIKEFYSGFLKANNQSQGIKSYSYVVALYVNYFDKKKDRL